MLTVTSPPAGRIDRGAELSRRGHICRIDLHRAGRRVGPDAVRFDALRRNGTRGCDGDGPARLGKSSDADAVRDCSGDAALGVRFTTIGPPLKLVARIPKPLLRNPGSAAAGPSIWIVEAAFTVTWPTVKLPSTAIPGFKGPPVPVTMMLVPGSVVTVAASPTAKMPLAKVPFTSIVPRL